MKTIQVKLASNTYPVYLGHGMLADPELWRRHLGTGKTLIVSNEVVAPLYLEAVRSALGGGEVDVHIIRDGEQFKTTDTWHGIIDKLVSMQARRDVTVIALGGGVVGDITGFAAACYMRGVRFLQAPTTLLAQVDASVGGKTAINHVKGKNLVGAFHQPAAVVIDPATLSTLAAREFNAGMAEVVKYGAIRDLEFFEWLEEHVDAINERDSSALDYLIHRSVSNKAEIVAADEREAGIRALLNFGHSFGHALEAETAYTEFLHGEAVSIGMVTAARLSESRKLCRPGTAQRISSLLSRFGLPVTIPAGISISGLQGALDLDKKAVASSLRLILLNRIGDAIIDKGSRPQEIITAMENSLDPARSGHTE
ncbi:MAG: 3-dehydroquinate synthase [Xanthomonadales bacterium]|nr:3-dehydroquinate synthase [Gammaproteobacteria bacterium]MBT8055125.1 3-dehydroquinate synthase [Gammaproteobacteria bacterium]NND58386.1 3-dehydroquinate synthase [Xanthomonadales bacterium]NNK51719.1 3-dehydroquinate synthase [Xanthomonadales bacterium]